VLLEISARLSSLECLVSRLLLRLEPVVTTVTVESQVQVLPDTSAVCEPPQEPIATYPLIEPLVLLPFDTSATTELQVPLLTSSSTTVESQVKEFVVAVVPPRPQVGFSMEECCDFELGILCEALVQREAPSFEDTDQCEGKIVQDLYRRLDFDAERHRGCFERSGLHHGRAKVGRRRGRRNALAKLRPTGEVPPRDHPSEILYTAVAAEGTEISDEQEFDEQDTEVELTIEEIMEGMDYVMPLP
jgi:hypothetical protein